MTTWSQRRQLILDYTTQHKTDSTTSDDELIHLATLEILHLESTRQELPPPLKRLKPSILSPDDFRFVSTLSSSGPFNRVELVAPTSTLLSRESASSRLFVMKTVDQKWAFRMRQQQSIIHELAVLRLGSSSTPSSTSSRIPRLIASFLSPTSFHFIISHASGGDLWSLLEASSADSDPERNEGLPENWVKGWMVELVDAVEWLHGSGWAHRDIKPHNLLLDSSGHLLLTDFGSSAPLVQTFSSPSSRLSTISRKHAITLVGTPDYIAPEILHHAEYVAQESIDFEEQDTNHDDDRNGGRPGSLNERAYGSEVDWWACGVVCYELLFGQAPFYAEEISETYERIVNFEKYLHLPLNPSVSRDARDFIASLLVKASERPTVSMMKSHLWFAGTDWTKLRDATPAYTPPPFDSPDLSQTNSFSRTSAHRSTESFTTFSASFFSSPGLSILRPSPSTVDGVRREERKFWDAKESKGLTTLPSDNAFSSSSSHEPQSSIVRSSIPIESPPLNPALDRILHLDSFQTPLRSNSSSRVIPSSSSGRVPAGGGTGSSRSRRVMTDVEAWKEMQEHAWEVGMSARKQQRVDSSRKKKENAVVKGPSMIGTVEVAANKTETTDDTEELLEQERLGRLEARHEEMVRDLEAMTTKYGSLFELAAREQKNSTA